MGRNDSRIQNSAARQWRHDLQRFLAPQVMASIKAADKSYADGRVGLRSAPCLVTAEHSLSTDSTFIGSISADRIREGLR
jgi:hypothetical protein